MKKFYEKEEKIILNFGGPEFPRTLEFIKQIPGRKYDPVRKDWSIPNTIENQRLLENFGFNGDRPWVSEDSVDESYKGIELTTPSFLRNYQVDALKYLKFHDDRAYLGANMGTGKTIMSLSHIEMNGYKKSLIVCPAGVKINFLKDYQKFYKKSLTILSGLDSIQFYSKDGIYVVNYELLSLSMETIETKYRKRNGDIGVRKTAMPKQSMLDFASSKFDCIIADEAHKLKNEESQAYQAFSLLAKDAKSVIPMSGTPILSRPAEVFGVMKVLKPKVFNDQNKYAFLTRYCGPKAVTIRGGGRIMTYTGATNGKELNTLLRKNGMLIIQNTDIDKELPEVISHVAVIELDANYQAYKEDLYDQIADNPGMVLSAIEKLKQFSVVHKLENCIDYINNILDIEEKVVIFASHKMVVEFLHKRYKNSVTYNGDVSPAQKEKNKEAFINDPKVKMIIGNTESMGIGVDGLQHSGSSSMVFIELAWNPAMHEQAIARLVRSGYNGKAHVNTHYLVGEGTIEEEIMELLDKKKGVFASVIKGEDVKEEDLLTYMKNKYLDEALAYSRKKNRR